MFGEPPSGQHQALGDVQALARVWPSMMTVVCASMRLANAEAAERYVISTAKRADGLQLRAPKRVEPVNVPVEAPVEVVVALLPAKRSSSSCVRCEKCAAVYSTYFPNHQCKE